MSAEKLAGLLGGRVGAVVVAAGSSQRMRGVDKVFVPLLGRPLVAYCLDALDACPLVDEVVLVLSAHNMERGSEMVRSGRWGKVRHVCLGGDRRQDSVRHGLAALSETKWVLIHDGARPCLTGDILLRGLEAVVDAHAAIAAVPVADTIKVVDQDGRIRGTPPRSELWAAQTPQVFLRELLERAYAVDLGEATDDGVLVERLGHAVRVFQGSPSNLKVTTPSDLVLVEALLSQDRPRARRDQ